MTNHPNRSAKRIEECTDIDALKSLEFCVQTNSGTYGASEAHRAIGVADPQFADYTVYERVGDGRRRVEGCDPERAPGYARYLQTDLLRRARVRIAQLSKAEFANPSSRLNDERKVAIRAFYDEQARGR